MYTCTASYPAAGSLRIISCGKQKILFSSRSGSSGINSRENTWMGWIPFIKKGSSIFLLPVKICRILTLGPDSGTNFTKKTGVHISKKLSTGLEMPLNISEDTPIRSPFQTAGSFPLQKTRFPSLREAKSRETLAERSLCPTKASCGAI